MLRALSDDALQALLREDAPYGDISTMALGLDAQLGHVVMAATQPMTVCGAEEAARLFTLAGATVSLLASSGSHVPAGAELLSAHGPAPCLLLSWRVAQALLEYASGVASEVARIVTELKAAGHIVPLACAAKSFPGTRALAIKAVHCGGGVMHRLGLSDSLMLSPEHLVFVDATRDEVVGKLRRAQPEKPLVAQVTSLQEAVAMAESGADILQLAHFTPEAVRQCRIALHTMQLHPMLAVGGAHAANAVAYADAGADVLVSTAPYHVPPREVEVRFARAV